MRTKIVKSKPSIAKQHKFSSIHDLHMLLIPDSPTLDASPASLPRLGMKQTPMNNRMGFFDDNKENIPAHKMIPKLHRRRYTSKDLFIDNVRRRGDFTSGSMSDERRSFQLSIKPKSLDTDTMHALGLPCSSPSSQLPEFPVSCNDLPGLYTPHNKPTTKASTKEMHIFTRQSMPYESAEPMPLHLSIPDDF